MGTAFQGFSFTSSTTPSLGMPQTHTLHGLAFIEQLVWGRQARVGTQEEGDPDFASRRSHSSRNRITPECQIKGPKPLIFFSFISSLSNSLSLSLILSSSLLSFSFFLFFKIQFYSCPNCCVMASGDLPASASQSAGITGRSHCAWPNLHYFNSVILFDYLEFLLIPLNLKG